MMTLILLQQCCLECTTSELAGILFIWKAPTTTWQHGESTEGYVCLLTNIFFQGSKKYVEFFISYTSQNKIQLKKENLKKKYIYFR